MVYPFLTPPHKRQVYSRIFLERRYAMKSKIVSCYLVVSLFCFFLASVSSAADLTLEQILAKIQTNQSQINHGNLLDTGGVGERK